MSETTKEMSVFKGIIKSRIHTGTFKTQSVINRFDNTKSADCMPCHESIEDYRHFLLHCNSLSNISKIHQNKLTEYMKENQINYNYVSRSEEESLKLAIDCSTNEWLPINHMVAIERICKNWIYALHIKRAELLW